LYRVLILHTTLTGRTTTILPETKSDERCATS
jgi:hypothetical protein